MELNYTQDYDRRIKKRFPVLKELNIPLVLYQDNNPDNEVEAVLLDISAGGMGLITFSQLTVGQKINLTIQIEHLDATNLMGLVVWSTEYKATWRVGIQFLEVDNQLAKEVDEIADDFQVCEVESALGAKDVCFKECNFYHFCKKAIKE